jgi:hypothetical protein
MGLLLQNSKGIIYRYFRNLHFNFFEIHHEKTQLQRRTMYPSSGSF